MFIVDSYSLAVVFCFVTMLCWGSWGNTQKLAAKSWRYELFYWDYVVGMLLFAFLLAFTAGSIGEEGRPFLADVAQASRTSVLSIVLGGVIFNASNILLSASTSIAGMSVAFPLGVGLALVLGVVNNYIVDLQQGTQSDVVMLALGVFLVVAAIVCNGVASGLKGNDRDKKSSRKGIVLAILAGVLMSFFYRFVAASMDLANFASPAAGKVTPYTALVIFSLGVFVSNIIFNTIAMRKPFVGDPVSYKDYFGGSVSTHLVGMLGGLIWCLGTALSYISSGKAGAAVSYALGQGAPMIAAVWGVFVWKEFKGAPRKVFYLLAAMFVLFIAGLGCIVMAGKDDGKPAISGVILETDMGNDVDDALAFDLLVKETKANGISFLGVGSHKPSNSAAPYVDMLATWYGLEKLPIAESHALDTCFTTTPDYTAAVVKMKNEDGTPLFARSRSSFEDPVKMYRRLLAGQKNHSVVIVSLGMASELANLLDSKADEFSKLDGKSLVAKKVRFLSIMCGSTGDKRREFNVRNDISSMQKLFDSWPGDIFITPYEIGVISEYPAEAIESGFSWAVHHPVVEGYRNFLQMPYDRPVWDILAVAYVFHPEMFVTGPAGSFTITDEGTCSFEEKESGRHHILALDKASADAAVEYIVKETTKSIFDN